VVVVGTGLARLAAAIEAASRGATVVVIEKMPEDKFGGNTAIAGGSMIVHAKIHGDTAGGSRTEGWQ